MTPAQIEFYKRLAHGLALQFGPNCEVVVHDLETEDVDHSIVVIENGHVSGRKLGDGPSHIVFESMHEGTTDVHDREPYLTKTADGKLLKSSTIFIRNDEGKPVGRQTAFAQLLAGLAEPARPEGEIEQRFSRGRVAGLLGTDHDRRRQHIDVCLFHCQIT